MEIKEKIGPHTFEMRSTGMGSISPWFMDILNRYHISAWGTSDIRDYIRYDGKIYCMHRFDYDINERISIWKEMYKENKEDVEKDIQNWIEKYCDTEFGGYTLDDRLKSWRLEIVKHLEWIRENDDTIHVGEATFENMCKIFGEMVNKDCYLPTDDFDVCGSENYMTMDIPIDGKFKARLEVFDNGFQYTYLKEDGSIFYSGLKEINKNNVSEFTDVIKKPREIKNGGSKKN